MNPDILSGAYGSLPSHQGVDPLAIGDKHVRDVHHTSYSRYAKYAGKVATNTFRVGKVLKNGQADRFQDIVTEHVRLLGEIISPGQSVVVALGPWGDCYKPEEAPSFAEGADHWAQAFEILLRIRGRIDIALAETINTGAEAEAIAEGWKRVQKHNRSRIELVTSLIPSPYHDGKLYNGESLDEVARRVSARTGEKPALGLNCFPIQKLEPALRALAGNANARLIYPNTGDGDPAKYEGSDSAVTARSGLEVGRILHSVLERFHEVFPSIVRGECCGSDPDRIDAIAKASKSRLETSVPVA